MNSVLKKIVFVVAFILIALVLPTIVMLTFVDTTSSFSTYIIVFGIILFAIFGYIIASVRSMEKKLEDALEEIKMQNAAIAYKISNTDIEVEPVKQEVVPEVKNETLNIPLNPAEPLVMPEMKQTEKVIDDNFDDFK